MVSNIFNATENNTQLVSQGDCEDRMEGSHLCQPEDRDNYLSLTRMHLCLFQLFEFTASDETPCAVAFHPLQQILACGFDTGVVRTISLAASKLIEEHKYAFDCLLSKYLTFVCTEHFPYTRAPNDGSLGWRFK